MQIDRPISIVIILFAVLLFSFFFAVPKYKDLKTLELDLARKKAEYSAQFDYYSEIANNYDKIKKREDDIRKIDDALPQTANFGQLAYYLQNQAENNGLILKNMTLSQSATGNVKDVSFSLSLSGDYHSLENFIVSLEKSARLFEVSSISFGGSSALAKSAGVTIQAGQSPEEAFANQFSDQQVFSFSLEVKTHSY